MTDAQNTQCPKGDIAYGPNLLALVFLLASLAVFIVFERAARVYFIKLSNITGLNVEADIWIALVIISVMYLPMLVYDLFIARFQNRFKAEASELGASWQRVSLRLLGLYATILSLGFIYWLLPEYGDYYERFWALLKLILPPIMIFAPAYIVALDHRQSDADARADSCYQLGAWILSLFKAEYRTQVKANVMGEHVRAWLIKGFFMPLMFIFLFTNITNLMDRGFEDLFKGAPEFFSFLFVVTFTVDLAFAAIGYMATFKLTDGHIKSAEPTVIGWVVCLMCYPPFWASMFKDKYLAYNDGLYWGAWLADSPVMYGVWGGIVLLLLTLYSMATVSLGHRFSNMTYRGLTTRGVYRLTKHPAYVFKNLSWWFISIPFIVHVDALTSVRNCLLLLALNFVYYMRARTEENHLSNYPEYVEYARWIDENGIFRFMRKLTPALMWDEKRALASGSTPWWKK